MRVLRCGILLKSPKKPHRLMVEFAVTHKCDEEKIGSGERILELQIGGDDEIAAIRGATISVDQEKTKAHNFRVKARTANFCFGSCPRPAAVFVVDNSGRPKLFQVAAGKCLDFKPPTAVWRKVLSQFEDAPNYIGIEQRDYMGTDLPAEIR